jgi:hypothetical protein
MVSGKHNLPVDHIDLTGLCDTMISHRFCVDRDDYPASFQKDLSGLKFLKTKTEGKPSAAKASVLRS